MANKIIVNDFYCTQCGKRNIPISRKIGKQREPGHLKKLFCIYCQKENNCVEITENSTKYTVSDFFNEFDNGNFNLDGTRTMPYKEFKQYLHKKEGNK